MPKREHCYQTVIVVLLLTAGWVFVAGAGRRSPETDMAAPGAPLYEYTVTESVKSLMSKEEQAELGAEGRPPSPGPDYFWCENCKTYHKRQAPASPGQPAAAPSPGAVPASPQPPDAASSARPPSPGAGYYWCEQCNTYHQKQANQPGAALQESPGALAPREAPAAGPGEGTYWCEQCNTYHRQQSAAQRPGASPAAPQAQAAPPAVGTVAAQALGGDYYYCEKCKTYHRRQPVAQQPVVDLSRIVGGVSNSPNRRPLIGPAGAEQ
jgi:hypothetical protein